MDINDIINTLYKQYFKVFSDTEEIPVKIILTDNLAKSHYELRPDRKEELIAQNIEAYNIQNERMVTPRSNDEPTYILLNTKMIKKYTEDGSMTWVGTLAHELTHAIDYNQFANREGLNSLDIIEGTSNFYMFQLWSEYHARKRGYYFLRLFFENQNMLDAREIQVEHILQTEWPFHMKNHFREYHENTNGNNQMYITMQLLGRYSVWCDLFPDDFNKEAFARDYAQTPWMVHLFTFLRAHETLDDIYGNFKKLKAVFAENWTIT